MKEKYRKQLITSIRENFNQGLEPFYKLKPSHCNCYQFAVGSTVPTEVYVGEKRGRPQIRSTVGENWSYFGRIGAFGGMNYYPTTEQELIEALKSDCEVLGLKCEQSDDITVPQEGTRKIALFYDRNAFLPGKPKFAQFHIMRYENGAWYHKLNWKVPVCKVKDGIESSNIKVDNLEWIGTFLLTIM